MKDRKPWSFCETPKEKCTMNYCDENGCQNRKRNCVGDNDLIADISVQSEQLCPVCGSEDLFDIDDNYTLCQKCLFQFVGV